MNCCFIRRIYTPFEHDDAATDVGSKLWMSLANAFILLGAVIVMTIFLILLYKYRCYKASCLILAILCSNAGKFINVYSY